MQRLATFLVGVSALTLGCADTTSPPSAPNPPSTPAPPVAITGSIELWVTTVGFDLDADGYRADVQADRGRVALGAVLPANGTVLLANLAAGDWSIVLHGSAGNCSIDGGMQKIVKVGAGVTTRVDIVVRCVESGAITFTTTTTGTDPDPDGYFLSDHIDLNAGVDTQLPTSGTVTVTALLPGEYLLSLGGLIPNCAAVKPGPYRATVGTDTAHMKIDVNCVTPARIAFVMGAAGDADIYLVNSNATGLLRLTSDAKADVNPAWSPDGSRIAFTSERAGNREIYVMNHDGSNVVRLTDHAAADYLPAWSPDGERIAFVSERDGNAEIYLMNADGSSPSRRTANFVSDSDPSWSPDGSMIAFTSGRSGAGDIYVMNADGSGTRQLTSDSDAETHPTWSRDGRRIAYSGGTGHGFRNIFVVSTDGTGVSRLSEWSHRRGNPEFSPDGNMIVFDDEDCWDYGPCPRGVLVYTIGGDWPFLIAFGAEPTWSPR